MATRRRRGGGGAPTADVGISIAADNNSPNTYTNVVLTVSIINNGMSDVTTASVSFPLGSGLSYVSNVPSQGAYNSDTGVWTVGAIANGATKTLAVTASVLNTGSYASTATVTASSPNDPVAGNNSATKTLTPVAFAPSQITGIVGWWKSDTGVSTSASHVTTWADQSGAGNNITDSGSGLGPLITANFQNGIQALNFDGSGSNFRVVNLTLGSSQTFVWVGKCENGSGSLWMMEHTTTIGGGNGSYMFSTGNNAMDVTRSSSNATIQATNWFGSTTGYFISRYNQGSNTFTLRKNGASQSGTPGGSCGSANVSADFFVGSRGAGSLYAIARLLELMIFNAAITDADITHLETYIQGRYAF